MSVQTYTRKWSATPKSGLPDQIVLSADEIVRLIQGAQSSPRLTPLHIVFVRPTYKVWPKPEFAGFSDWPEGELLNSLSYHMDTEKIISVLCNLLEFWYFCAPNLSSNVRRVEDGLRIFGSLLGSVLGFRLLFTLTADERELRCWYGIPGYTSGGTEGFHHVDSDSQGLLFSISGPPEEIRKCVDGVFHEAVINHAIELPNGVKLYGLHWGRIK